jgi:phosphosulfolactate synthase (CoM biosynthesis protein A)
LKYSDDHTKRNISFDEYYRNIGVYFNLTNEGAELALDRVTKKFPHYINYSNNAGIKEIQIKDGVDTISILEGYYNG